jgi:hypothetical protein
MPIYRVHALERLTRIYWESDPDTLDWDALKKYEPQQARRAYERMRALIQALAGDIGSPADRAWLGRVATEETLEV